MPPARRRDRPGLPLLPVAPVLVVVVGVLVAVAVALVGLRSLRRASDEAAALRAETLASTLAARLRVTGSEDRAEVVQRAGHRSGADILLLEQDGEVVVDASLGAPDQKALIKCLLSGAGEIATAIGRTRFAARPLGPPLEHLSIIAFVPAPATPAEARGLVKAVATLTTFLVGVAGIVAYIFAKDARDDVAYVRKRIAAMAKSEAPGHPGGEPIPVRSLDQVGVLTSAFNRLVHRFTAAELSYRKDLAIASTLDAERSAFLAALSHELRTPLNAILGFTDILLSEVDGPLDPAAHEELGVIRKSASHLRALIDDVLELSAIESGGLRLRCEAVDVHAVADEVVKEAAAGARAKGLFLTLTGDANSIADADANRVRQVLGNIVGNAVKFTKAGQVSVHVERQSGQIVVTTKDTGPGIAAAERAIIFEEFHQLGDERARRRGTGLGLAIARRLIAMHGGSIELESTVGQGSSFIVRLPQYPARAPGEPPPGAARISDRPPALGASRAS